MDVVFGFVGKDFSVVVTDCGVPRSIVVMKQFEDKIVKVAPRTVFALGGEVSDRDNFSDYIAKNIKWYEMRNGRPLTNHGIANFTRGELSRALRQGPYQCNVLQAGYDDADGPSLYYMDYLGSLMKVPHGAHGYCSFFLLSLFDRHWKKDMELDDAFKLIGMCIKQLRGRFLVQLRRFKVKVVSKDGVRVITDESLYMPPPPDGSVPDFDSVNYAKTDLSTKSAVDASGYLE